LHTATDNHRNSWSRMVPAYLGRRGKEAVKRVSV